MKISSAYLKKFRNLKQLHLKYHLEYLDQFIRVEFISIQNNNLQMIEQRMKIKKRYEKFIFYHIVTIFTALIIYFLVQ